MAEEMGEKLPETTEKWEVHKRRRHMLNVVSCVSGMLLQPHVLTRGFSLV